MSTKSQYREYIASEQWQDRRRQYLSQHTHCAECGLPRWLAIVAFDQDLHVHHHSYARVGHELDEDLQALCRRCHEIKTFGNSALHAPTKRSCVICGRETWDSVDRHCDPCRALMNHSDSLPAEALLQQCGPAKFNWPLWHDVLSSVIDALEQDRTVDEACEAVRQHLSFESELRKTLEKAGEEERAQRGDS